MQLDNKTISIKNIIKCNKILSGDILTLDRLIIQIINSKINNLLKDWYLFILKLNLTLL